MQFIAKVKSVKADVAAGMITLSFVAAFDDLPSAEKLAGYASRDAGKVVLTVTPHQPTLLNWVKVEGKEGSEG